MYNAPVYVVARQNANIGKNNNKKLLIKNY